MLDTVQTALLKKWNEDQLASLYLLSYNSESTEAQAWAAQFQKELTPLQDHPDILKLSKGPKDSEYKVDSPAIGELLSFISTHPLQLKKKVIFLFDAQDLSVIVSNKLLKVFEELGPEYCLMLFAPRNASLLDTVLSRAVKLSLPEGSGPAKTASVDFSKLSTPAELIQWLREQDDEALFEKKYIEEAIEQCLEKAQYREIEQLLNALRDYETRLAFNNSRLSRLAPFFP